MADKVELIDIVQATLGTFDHRQSFSPGMFEPLKPLFQELGYESAAVYITDDYPDRMNLTCAFGKTEHFPAHVILSRRKSLLDEMTALMKGVPGVMVERLFSHDRELGVVVATTSRPDERHTREAFDMLVRSVSVMAYVERIRINDHRERLERDIFFAQSLTSRLLIREAPKLKDLRLGFEFIRSLEAGGDFFDFIPGRDGGLLGFIGCCNGKGLRTVLEVTGIMRTVHRALHNCDDLADVLLHVNEYLIKEKKRAHQASLAVFRVDPARRTLSVAKSGRMAMLLCGPGTHIDNISAPGAMFLGMMENPDIHHDEYEFNPGQSLFCVTEGIYSARNCLNARPQLHWFIESVATVLETRRRKPLANAIFDTVNKKHDHGVRPDDSLLAVSVEFTGRNRESMRLKSS